MRVTSCLVTFTVVSVLCICLLCQPVAGQTLGRSNAPAQQLVVLQNGEVLKGQITETATSTIVRTRQGSRLVLSNERVDFVCDSIQDAYWGKCARTKASDVAGQKLLFYWCLKHELHQQAQNQILMLAQSETAKASDVEFLDRQLNISIVQSRNRNQDKAHQQLAQSDLPSGGSTQPTTPPESPANLDASLVDDGRLSTSGIVIDSSIGTGLLVESDVDYNTFTPLPAFDGLAAKADPASSGDAVLAASDQPEFSDQPKTSDQPKASDQQMIRQVGFDEEIDLEHKTISLEHRLPNPIKPLAAPVQPEVASKADLDRMTRLMPAGTIGPYRSGLERVLINGCSAANCHDSRSQVMPLLDLGRSKPITRRMSQRNLYETLKHVDRSNPFASPLLRAASQAHGGGEDAILPAGSKHFEQLKLWVIMLSNDPEANYQAYLNPSLQQKSPALPAAPTQDTSTQEDIVPVEPERIGLGPLVPAAGHSQTIGEIPELNSQSEIYQPTDPFDPEIFNRRFGDQ